MAKPFQFLPSTGAKQMSEQAEKERSNLAGFHITGGKGFHITFENGWTVSVQFGPGNYCDNYDRSISDENEICGREGSATAECAVWGPDGEMVTLPDATDTVTNRSTPAEVLGYLQYAASRPHA